MQPQEQKITAAQANSALLIAWNMLPFFSKQAEHEAFKENMLLVNRFLAVKQQEETAAAEALAKEEAKKLEEGKSQEAA